jgi:hypothetical protein
MTSINFTNSPSNDDTITVGGVTYIYSSSSTRWEATSSGTGTGLTAEQVQDVVGNQLVTNASHTGISFAYDDAGDGALDATIGTLNQNTTGSAATLTTARTIGGVSFNGSANINLPGVNAAGTQNTTGTAATVTGATQAAITSAANLVTVGTIGTGVWQGTAIASGYIAADAITGAKIADDAIDSEHYTDGSIDTAHIADDQVTAAKLANTAVTAAAYGSSSAIPVLTIDAQGRVTAASTAATSSVLTIAADSGSNDTVTVGTDTLTFEGTANEIETTVSNNKINLGLPTNVTIAGNLTVAGTQTTVSSTTITVADPLVALASNNNAADAVDIGLYGLYDTSGSQDLYSGLFRDASDSGKWKLFKDTQAAPTTTVNTSGTGYAVGTLVAALEGNVTGNASTATALATGRTVALSGDVVASGVSFDGTGNITLSSAIQDNTVGIAELAGIARGKIIYGDASGNPALLAVGSSGEVLKSDGTDIAWSADAGLSTEAVQDIVGGMFSSNTETGITVTYEDGDGTVDLVVGTLNQNTTGTAATVTGAAQTAITSVGTLTGLAVSGNQTVGGTLGVTGVISPTTHIDMPDNAKILLGTGDDLQIYHDGSDSVIADTGAGNLSIRAEDFYLMNPGGTEIMIRADIDGAVKLYYDNVVKIETSAAGVAVTGTLSLPTFTIPNSIGSSGQVLKAPSSGTTLEWGAVAAGGSSITPGASAPGSPSSGDVWWDSDDLNPYIYYNDGSSSQWVEFVSKAASASTLTIAADSGSNDAVTVGTDTLTFSGGTGVNTTVANNSITIAASGTVTVYATFALLIAATGMSTGDQAYVTATNKLYLYSVNGWFLVATISNASPTAITGVSSAYTLATDATATVITAVSTDPEGFPLTWSYAVTTGSLTNGGGATATVSQNANVFTITPTTTTAYAGTFSITFTVTDGVNGVVNAVGAFTLTFAYDWGSATQQRIQGSGLGANDYFGQAVSVDGAYTIVGADYATKAGGGNDAGAAYVFNLSGTTWSQQQKLVSSDLAAGDHFGNAVEIDGDTVAVGAYMEATGASSAGSVYVFTRSGTTWSQQQKIQSADHPSYANFGGSVALDSNTIVVGAVNYGDNSGQGAAYIFTRSGTTWSVQQKITASDGASGDYFGGSSASVSVSGDTLVVGAYLENSAAGSAYVFTRSGTTWTQQAKIVASDAAASDQFGFSVGIDGDNIIVGAWYDDDDGTSSGSAYVFTRSGTTWSQQAKLTASDGEAGDNFGTKVGIDVSVSPATVVVGAHNEDAGGSNAGAAYIFTRSGTTWSQQAKLTASNAGADDKFGTAVAIDDDTVVVGATGEDTTASGAGSAYVFLAE